MTTTTLLDRITVFAILLTASGASAAACSNNTGITRMTGVPASVSISDPYATSVPSVSFTINGITCVVDSLDEQSGSGFSGFYNTDLALMLYGAKLQGVTSDVNLFAPGRIDSVAYPYP
jgi:hypothetical protein